MDVTTHVDDRTLTVSFDGRWSVAEPVPEVATTLDGAFGDPGNGVSAPHSPVPIDAAPFDTTPVDTITFDTGQLEAWDSTLLVFLLDLYETAEDRGWEVDDRSLPDDIRQLLTLARAVPEQEAERDPPPEALPAKIGEALLTVWDDAWYFVKLTGEVTLSAGRALVNRSWQGRDFRWVLQNSTASALPIVTLIAFLVGLILSFLGAVVLRRFGADYYVSYLVCYGMLRELGALMTAIIMAGRTGAAFAAELGSMKIREEIDALRTLGLSPVDVLVLPRVAAVFVALPLLTIYADVVGILGGWAVAVSMLDVTTPQFFVGLTTPVTLADAVLGVVKGTVYGAIIGMTGCFRGLRTGNDAAAVGDAATSAVVLGITMVVLANALIDWMAALLNV